MDLFESVAFDAPTLTPDGSGGDVRGWSTVGAGSYACAAHFRYLRGGESVMAARLDNKQPIIVTIWNCIEGRAITADWRMRDLRTGRAYNVRTDPVPNNDRSMLEIMCESGVAI